VYLSYLDADGGYIEVPGFVCDGTTLTPPGEARYVEVSVQDPAVGNVTCLGEDTHAPTTGTVTAEVAYEPGDACGGARARSTGPVE
jgi:hypothetical protein